MLQSMTLVIAVLAGVGALAVSVAVLALAAEQDSSAYTRAYQAYDAKWDKCEALASKRGYSTSDKGSWGVYEQLRGEVMRPGRRADGRHGKLDMDEKLPAPAIRLRSNRTRRCSGREPTIEAYRGDQIIARHRRNTEALLVGRSSHTLG
jgi:hypothetical protein